MAGFRIVRDAGLAVGLAAAALTGAGSSKADAQGFGNPCAQPGPHAHLCGAPGVAPVAKKKPFCLQGGWKSVACIAGVAVVGGLAIHELRQRGYRVTGGDKAERLQKAHRPGPRVREAAEARPMK